MAEYSLPQKHKNALNVAGIATPSFYEISDPAAFRAAIEGSRGANQYAASVFVYPGKEYEKIRLFVSQGGRNGFALNGDDAACIDARPAFLIKRATRWMPHDPTSRGHVLRCESRTRAAARRIDTGALRLYNFNCISNGVVAPTNLPSRARWFAKANAAGDVSGNQAGRDDPPSMEGSLFLIPVFFRPELVGPEQRYSPSAHKPAAVVADWQRQGFPIQLLTPEPVTQADLCLAHEARYVDAVFAGTEPNGFGNHDPAIARSTLFTNGAMLAAGQEAISNRRVAVAPVSGFHHANHGFGGGYCTFNGLMVAAIRLRREGLAKRVGILDCDQHYGNGTDDIIDELGIDWIRHVSIGREHRQSRHAGRFLAELAGIVAGFAGCDLLLYQAGADPHVDDPLGGWLTTAQLAERDRIVFEAARELGLPIAWNLAGGYQRDADGGIEPVLAIHRATMRACAEVFCGAAPARKGGRRDTVARGEARPDRG